MRCVILDALATVLAGLAAGTLNAVVGSGTLITFPILMALGLPPVVANMTSSVGLLGGNLSSVPGYRKAIAQARPLLRLMAPASLLGGIVGSLLLLVLPSEVFQGVVPALVGLAVALVAIGPWVQRQVAARRAHDENGSFVPRWVLLVLVFGTGIYGGYYGAAQGVLLIGLLGVLTTTPLQVANGLKVVLALLVNLVGSLVFICIGFGRIDWWHVLLVFVGSAVGGVVGARIGQRLHPTVLRGVVITVGLIALARLLMV